MAINDCFLDEIPHRGSVRVPLQQGTPNSAGESTFQQNGNSIRPLPAFFGAHWHSYSLWRASAHKKPADRTTMQPEPRKAIHLSGDRRTE